MITFTPEITIAQQDFMKWVLQQDGTREIDHDGGWSSCAVGEYARESGAFAFDAPMGACPPGYAGWSQYSDVILPADLNDDLNVGQIVDYDDLAHVIRERYIERER